MKTTRNKGSRLIWLILLLVAIGTAGTGYLVFHSKTSDKQTAANAGAKVARSEEKTPAADETATTGTIIKTGASQYGPMLFDNRGQAIYIWQLEDSSTAECYDDCAIEWPPVITDGAPVASTGVNGQLLGTTKRTDGTSQVTYNGHPLYFYAHENPGEVECHNIRTHGGLWWVIQPNGARAI